MVLQHRRAHADTVFYYTQVCGAKGRIDNAKRAGNLPWLSWRAITSKGLKLDGGRKGSGWTEGGRKRNGQKQNSKLNWGRDEKRESMNVK